MNQKTGIVINGIDLRSPDTRIVCSNVMIESGEVDAIFIPSLQETDKAKDKSIESRQIKTSLINNRRYLGNKYKLLDFIKDVVDNECKEINVVADIFAGTGAFASAFPNKEIITNDILYFNYICHVAWFSSEKYNIELISNLIGQYNLLEVLDDNYMSENFANSYFSIEDCRKIGYIREDIKDRFESGEINFREHAILLTSLMYAMDKIANTCGHYDAYRKGGNFDKRLELSLPLVPNTNSKENKMYNEDANKLVRKIKADLVYIDPPYNSRQYCDAYHLLENVSRWEKKEVFGTAKKMDRSGLKSDYCTTSATKAFKDLIENIKAKYILVSYNNMASKGNARSNARINDSDIIRILEKKGKVKIFSKSYKAFTTGKSKIPENEERLFLCVCE